MAEPDFFSDQIRERDCCRCNSARQQWAFARWALDGGGRARRIAFAAQSTANAHDEPHFEGSDLVEAAPGVSPRVIRRWSGEGEWLSCPKSGGPMSRSLSRIRAIVTVQFFSSAGPAGWCIWPTKSHDMLNPIARFRPAFCMPIPVSDSMPLILGKSPR
jgi:hypothetical protein